MRATLLVVLLAGCHHTASEPAVSLGQQNLIGYHVLAGAETAIPDGDIGFLVTANGAGGYRVTWIDTAGSSAAFSGSATTDVSFDANSTLKYSGSEDVSFTADNRIDFSGVPGATLEGVDFVANTDPVYFDLSVDGSRSGFGIFFTGAHSGLVEDSPYNPVAFTSP